MATQLEKNTKNEEGQQSGGGGGDEEGVDPRTSLPWPPYTGLHNRLCASQAGTYRSELRPATGYPVGRLPSFNTKTAAANV